MVAGSGGEPEGGSERGEEAEAATEREGRHTGRRGTEDERSRRGLQQLEED